MTFATSWELSCRKCRFHNYKVKYNYYSKFLRRWEAIKPSNQAILWRLHTWPGMSKIYSTITPSGKSVFSSRLCINIMFINMDRSHWFTQRKACAWMRNLIIPQTKCAIQVWTVNAQWCTCLTAPCSIYLCIICTPLLGCTLEKRIIIEAENGGSG